MNDLKIFLSEEYECDHLISFYGAFYEEGLIKIILELMDLGSARDLINIFKSTHALPFDEAFLSNFSRQVLLGLHYLHTKKHQLHRDIKPENILLNS
jgi:serine/threonine protein kinase